MSGRSAPEEISGALTDLYSRAAPGELWIFVGLILALWALILLVVLRGVTSDWYRSLSPVVSIPWYLLGVLWAFFFLVLIVGFWLTLRWHPGIDNVATSVYFASLFLVANVLTLFWVTLFFYGRAFRSSFLAEGVLVLFYLFLFYELYRYGGWLCVFVLPLLLLSIYSLFVASSTTLRNGW